MNTNSATSVAPLSETYQPVGSAEIPKVIPKLESGVAPARPISRSMPVRESVSPEAYIKYLILQFRCLRGKVSPNWRFDAIRLEKVSRAWAHGERVAVLFVLSVWSGHNWKGKGKAFDLVDACSVLCPDDRQVIIDWIAHPYFP